MRAARVVVLVAGVLAAGCAGGSVVSSAPTSTSTTTTTTATTTSTAPVATTTTSAPPSIQGVVDRFVAGRPVLFSVEVADLATGTTAAHLGDRQVLSASLYKLFVARELLDRLAAGQLDPNRPAAGRTIDRCIDDMIVVSDNACGVAGLDLIGRGAMDAGLRGAGYVHTSLATPQRTSASDIALFLTRARGEGGRLYDLLRRQQVNDRLPQGLPPGTAIAHKTGDRIGWAHDAGIVTTPQGDLLVVVLSGPWAPPCCDADRPGPGEATAFGAIAELGRNLYEAVSAGR